MSEQWHTFLSEQGLAPGADGHTYTDTEDTGRGRPPAGDTICDLGHTVMVHAGGADSGDFLQNQLTNDVGSLESSRATVAGYCNPKGRLICLFRIWRDDDGFILQLPAGLHEDVINRLRKYVLRARVEFTSLSEQVAFGVCGESAAAGLQEIAGQLPARSNDLVHAGELTIVRLPAGDRPRYQVAGTTTACMDAWRRLAAAAATAGSWTWAREDILAGIPTIVAATSESFIPQMVNLDRLDAVNFRKGCYPGQEIVARMHYLGNLKQRMGRFRTGSDTRPQPGDRVFTRGSTSPTGTVVDAQPAAGPGWDLLAVARIEDLDGENLRLGGEEDDGLLPQPLPYVIVGDGE